MEPSFEIFNLSDDGIIPNSKYPVIVYHYACTLEGSPAADFLETRFAENGWNNAFRWRIYDFHHYHTNTHEVLGVYSGYALLQLGGPEGKKLHVRSGDVLVLPAGTGHNCLSNSDDLEWSVLILMGQRQIWLSLGISGRRGYVKRLISCLSLVSIQFTVKKLLELHISGINRSPN